MNLYGTDQRVRIALTGGPGGGKTTAADLFRREIGEQIVIVPESATMLFGGGFPRRFNGPEATKSTQQAIYHVQRNLEDVQGSVFPNRVLLCDRGTVDGAAYWPGTPDDFFETIGSTLETELARYDAVIFFETAAKGDLSIEGGNPTRIEDNQAAVDLDQSLFDLWSSHPRFVFVPHNASFFKKITFGLASLESMVNQLLTRPNGGAPRRPPAPEA